jgi:hypothetical protein
MTTEAILHGYQIIIVPRIRPCLPEVVITAPYTDDKRYTAKGLSRWRAQLERELAVVAKAQEMRDAAEQLAIQPESTP